MVDEDSKEKKDETKSTNEKDTEKSSESSSEQEKVDGQDKKDSSKKANDKKDEKKSSKKKSSNKKKSSKKKPSKKSSNKKKSKKKSSKKKSSKKKSSKKRSKKRKKRYKKKRRRRRGRRHNKKFYKEKLKNSSKIKRIKDEVQSLDDIDELKRIRDKYNDQTGEFINQIKKLQNEMNELQDKAYDYKAKRDKLNKKVAKIKDRKYEIIDELKKVTAELREAKKGSVKTTSGQSWNDVKRKIYKIRNKVEHLERRIETEDLSLADENKLVDEIGRYEAKLQHLYSLKPTNQFKEYYDKIGELKEELEKVKERLTKFADESQNWHLLYIDLSKEIRELQNEKDLLQKELNENKYVADIYHNRLVEVSQKLKRKKIIRKKSQYRNKKKARKEIKKLTLQDAKDKLEKGKKLNIFEARALMEDRVNN